METGTRVRRVAAYVKAMMDGPWVHKAFRIGHGFRHVDRVRRWAVHLAQKEGFASLDVIEAAALLYDVGLSRVEDRKDHASAGAEMAVAFLRNGTATGKATG